MKLQLCFNHPKKAILPDGRREAIDAFIDSFAEDDEGTFRTTGYSGYVGKKTRFNAENCDFRDVAEALDSFWEDFVEREERAVLQLIG